MPGGILRKGGGEWGNGGMGEGGRGGREGVRWSGVHVHVHFVKDGREEGERERETHEPRPLPPELPPCCPQYKPPHWWSGNGGTEPGLWQTAAPTHPHPSEPTAGSAASHQNTACDRYVRCT